MDSDRRFRGASLIIKMVWAKVHSSESVVETDIVSMGTAKPVALTPAGALVTGKECMELRLHLLHGVVL
jgi:hypothetical protein